MGGMGIPFMPVIVVPNPDRVISTETPPLETVGGAVYY
jgi:hypothetical protein